MNDSTTLFVNGNGAARGNDSKGDNLAEYTENYFCFSCGYNKPKRNIENVKRILSGLL